jgi:hypothetical protein
MALPTSNSMTDSRRTALALLGGLLLLLVFLGQGLFFIAANSQTFDEAVHLTAGYSYLGTGDFRLNSEDPPLIKFLQSLPIFLGYHLPFEPDPKLWREAKEGQDHAQWRISQDFLYGSSVPADQLLALGRIPNLLLGTCLVALIGWWAYRLWGRGAALLAMSLAALEPNLVAHASLITTDMGITLCTFLTLYLLWEYSACPSRLLLCASGLALGLGLVSKFSSLLLVGMVGVVIGFHVFSGGSFALLGSKREQGMKGLPARVEEAVAPFLRVLCLGLLVIPVCYEFQGFSDWCYGLRTQMNQQTTGKEAFFLGEYSEGGWWNYFLVAFLLKTPVGSLTLILLSLLLYRAGSPLRRREVVFLLAPVVFYMLALTKLRLNIGLRYALPIYPFLFVLASRLATLSFRRTWVLPVLLAVPLSWNAISSLRVAPHQLAYFNEFVGGPEEGYRYLSNSNVDWGQDLRSVKEYMEREGLPMIYLSYYGTAPPAYYGIRHQYVPGYGQLEPPTAEVLAPNVKREVLAISVVSLQGVHCEDNDLFRWLEARTPIAKIGYSIFVYDLTGDTDAHLHLAEVYVKVGPHRLVEPELRKVLALDPTRAVSARFLPFLH